MTLLTDLFPGGGSGLADVVDDTTPQLGGDLDMNGHNIGGNTEAQIDDAVAKKHAATLIGTKTIDESDIANTKVIAYNSTSGNLEYELPEGGGGGGLNWSVVSINTNAETGCGYLINASSNNVTLTLPATPSVGNMVGVCDFYDKATTNTITIARNTKNISGTAEDLVVDINSAGFTLVYSDSTIGWEIVTEISNNSGGGGGLDNVVEDTTPQLGGDLDVNGHGLGAQAVALNMNTHKVTGVVDPTADQEVATKKYVDDNAGGISDNEFSFAWDGVTGTGASKNALFDKFVESKKILQDLLTVNWTARTAAATNQWRSICWSPELELFVAVAQDGTNRVMTSPDGITWTIRTAAAASGWTDVCWSPELTLFVAVAYSGTNRVMTSPDGITWTIRTAAAASNWFGVCWSSGLTLFVAVAYDGTNRVMTSPDGITWTIRTAAAASNWFGVCWSSGLTLFVAVAYDGTNRVMTSPDGITWTIRTAAAASGWRKICWSSELSLFVAVAYNGADRVMTSPDGITWTIRTAAAASSWDGVCWSSELSLFVAVAYDGTDRIMTSPYGITWTVREAAAASGWRSVCWSSELSLFVAVADSGTDRVMTSLRISSGGGGGLDNVVEDTTPQLGGDLDVNGHGLGAQAVALNMNTHKVTGVVDPTADQEVATKKYVDDAVPAGSQGNMLIRGASAWLAEQVEFNPNMYTGTDTQKIQAAITAAIAVGGIVHIIGSWTVTEQIAINGGCTIYGDGNNGATTINTTNSNFVVFYINTANTVNIRDIKFIDSGTPTAGAAIKVEYTGGDYNQRSTFQNLLIYNHYVGIDLVEATLYSIDKCHINNCKKYGVKVQNTADSDYGLATITDSYFQESIGNQDAAIRYESGGGLKITNCWFLGNPVSGEGHNYGIDLVVANAITTVDLIIANNHFENLDQYSIRLDTATSSGSFGNIQINNNEFVSWGTSTGAGILIDPSLDSQIFDVIISSNLFNNCGVRINNGTDILIANNIFQNGSNIIYAINNIGGINVTTGLNHFPGHTAGTRGSGTFSDVYCLSTIV